MIRQETLEKLESVNDENQHALFVKEYRKAKIKADYISLYEKILEYTETLDILETNSLELESVMNEDEEYISNILGSCVWLKLLLMGINRGHICASESYDLCLMFMFGQFSYFTELPVMSQMYVCILYFSYL